MRQALRSIFRRKPNRIKSLVSGVFLVVALFAFLVAGLSPIFKSAHVAAASPASYRYTKTFDTTNGNSHPYGVATDSAGNIYIVGTFSGTVVFDGTGGSDSRTSSGGNVYLSKFSSTGSYDYTKTFDVDSGGASADAYGVATDKNNNVFITGDFLGSVVFDGTGGSDNQTSVHQDAYITKFNANGTYGNTKVFDTASGLALGNSLTVDKNGNLFVTGYFGGTVVFDGTGGSDSHVDSGSGHDAFLTKYNADGSYGYTKTFDVTAGGASASSVATDSNGNVYETGDFTDTVVFDGVGGSDSQTASSSDDSYLTRYNADGSYGYTKIFDNNSGSADGYSVAVDGNNNIYIAGYFDGTISFDGVGGSDSQTTPNEGTFLTKYQSNGTYLYTKTFDTTNGNAYSSGVATDSDNNVYITGYEDGTVIFDGAGGSDSYTNTGSDDTYLTEYASDGSYGYTKVFDTSNGSADVSSVATNIDGGIYLAGIFLDTVVFDGAGGSDSQTDPGGNGDAFLTKFSTAGVSGSGSSGSSTSSTPAPGTPDTGVGIAHTHVLFDLGLVITAVGVLGVTALNSRKSGLH